MNYALMLAAGVASLPPSGPVPGSAFRECDRCPEMVVVPAGRFVIGSPSDEPGRAADEGPRTPIAIGTPFAVSRFEVTRGQYQAFLEASGRAISGNCITDRRELGQWQPDARTNLQDPGFPQADNHPVVCVTWHDARAYAAWLSAATGATYRLLSEAEWEYVARAGTATAYPWGERAEDGCGYMNGTDATFRAKYAALPYAGDFGTCDDGTLNTAPVGSYRANAFGLHDMIGNVGEWVEDCTVPTYAGLATDGAARGGTCTKVVVRGGSWGTIARQLRVAERLNYAPTDADDSIGIRVARTLP